jgi:hypothetical protein
MPEDRQDLVKTTLRLAPRLFAEVKKQAVDEGRDVQDFVAEALAQHLDRIHETGQGTWEALQESARRRGEIFRGWRQGTRGRLEPVFEKIETAKPKKGAKS